jgi:hypothetical protein
MKVKRIGKYTVVHTLRKFIRIDMHHTGFFFR